MPSNLPVSTIKVLHVDYDLVAMPPDYADASNQWGDTDKSKRIIRVDTRAKPRDVAEVLLHELIHAVWEAMGIPGRPREERAVRAISTGLTTVWRDNPALHKWYGKQIS